ncbi:response regulator transcription factor [Lysinibacillus antri]|uniref:LuxR family transcriptional regulator n=1 Tax=Lysinibacillus antri TaxID=2498145 RepID=A0A3S0QNX3_9BACI|nr:helix-turn-helix transcriptional regulator [Lysinibacillus antri]RUL50499.1 LuxR family transcriptional regulator [Lysinibacillus antri]
MRLTSWILEEKLKSAVNLQTQEEKICHLLRSLSESTECEKLTFYRFSPVGYVGESVAEIEYGQLQSSTQIRDDIRSLPVIRNVVENRKATYYSGQEIITMISSRYLRKTPLKGLLVIPIFVNKMTIAYICCEFIQTTPALTAHQLEQFTLFGEIAGDFLVQLQRSSHPKLSPRENEILKALANGLSTKELTHLLSLSEATIKQYIKSVLIKLGAKNRTHAVSIFLGQQIE